MSVQSEEKVTYLKKQCKCQGSSSGPRLIFLEEWHEDYLKITGMLCRMACDVCDKPWRIEDA